MYIIGGLVNCSSVKIIFGLNHPRLHNYFVAAPSCILTKYRVQEEPFGDIESK